jgi:uncharacterized protein
MNRVVGYQKWRRLLFVHWPVPATELRPLVPTWLSIDEFGGSAFVSLVAFAVEGARAVGMPSALGLHFMETNVRTYVYLDGHAPGVYFFSLEASSLAAVLGARLSLGLPYFWAAGHEHGGAGATDYYLMRRVARRRGCHVRYEVREHLGTARPGSLDHFLIERYVLYVQRASSVWRVGVEHRPYPLHDVRLEVLQENLVGAAGIETREALPLAHFASGVDVAISLPRIHPLR